LDFEGGILSVAQIVIDAVVCNDWSPIVGNPAKFSLGCSSMVFDVIFIVQHYVLYDDQQYASALNGLRTSGAELLLEGEDL
jgi:cystinosin